MIGIENGMRNDRGLFADGGGRKRAQSELQSAAVGAAANCATRRVANTFIIYSGSSLRGSRNERMRIAGLRAPRLRPARFSEPQNSRASANPAAGTISDKGRSRRRSVKIGDLLIASKVPKASDLAQSRGRPRNRFTAAAFGVTFWPRKR